MQDERSIFTTTNIQQFKTVALKFTGWFMSIKHLMIYSLSTFKEGQGHRWPCLIITYYVVMLLGFKS